MSARIPYQEVYQLQPTLAQALISLGEAVEQSGFSATLTHLVKLRASQLNGCAFCQHMHANEARQDGEKQARLDILPAWREVTGAFDAKEQAALAWTEKLTLLANSDITAADFDAVATQFTSVEIVNLTALIVAINGWNRIAVAFHFQPVLR